MGKKNGIAPHRKLRKALKNRNARRNSMAKTMAAAERKITGSSKAFRMPGSMKK